MTISKEIILFGTGDLAKIACLYFQRDTMYHPVCFTVDREYIKETELMGLPVVPYDELKNRYSPHYGYQAHVCLVYNKMNRCRADICKRMEDDGYQLASYVSPHAYVADTAKLGKHHFIFENNVIQDFVEIGDNCILWSGNHVGHSTKIGNNVFVSSHVCISGWCVIGDNCFIGVNSTLANTTTVGKESWISHASVISGEVPPNSFVKSVQSEVVALNEAALDRALGRVRR